MITAIEHRVNYSETDQMGLVYHANYVIWLDMARTEHLRGTGVTYKEMEEQGVYLAVTDLQVRYRRAARYD
ncbi:MAG TPA: thioesterase family protein, partial [Gemmatimonadales bacterium]|nr:thioesterase family protein [Gemmatimonadales bacterium]